MFKFFFSFTCVFSRSSIIRKNLLTLSNKIINPCKNLFKRPVSIECVVKSEQIVETSSRNTIILRENAHHRAGGLHNLYLRISYTVDTTALHILGGRRHICSS